MLHRWVCFITTHLGAVTAGGVALLLAVLAMLRGMVYRRVLRKLDAAREELNIEAKQTYATPIGQPEHKIIVRSGVWPWLARAALNWERDKKKGRL